jgi:hypothetical protein
MTSMTEAGERKLAGNLVTGSMREEEEVVVVVEEEEEEELLLQRMTVEAA